MIYFVFSKGQNQGSPQGAGHAKLLQVMTLFEEVKMHIIRFGNFMITMMPFPTQFYQNFHLSEGIDEKHLRPLPAHRYYYRSSAS